MLLIYKDVPVGTRRIKMRKSAKQYQYELALNEYLILAKAKQRGKEVFDETLLELREYRLREGININATVGAPVLATEAEYQGTYYD